MIETSLQHTEPAAITTGPSFGRMVRLVAGYAILIAVMLVSPLFVLLPAALFHCTFRNGRRLTWIALFIGAALAGAVVVIGGNAPQVTLAEAKMNLAYFVAVILAIALSSMVVAPMVERSEAFGRVLMTAILSGTVGLGLTEMVMQAGTGFSPFSMQVSAFNASAAQALSMYRKLGVPADVIGMMHHWLDLVVFCLPGFIVFDIIFVFVISLVLFGRLRAWRETVERHEPTASPYRFRNLSLPDWVLIAFIVGGLSPLATGLLQRLDANLLAVVAFLYLLQGLAIFRFFLVASGVGFFGAFFAYLLLAVLTPAGIAPLLLSVTGLFDSFFDFRKFTRKDHTDESHLD